MGSVGAGRNNTSANPYQGKSLDELKEIRKDIVARTGEEFAGRSELSESEARRFYQLAEERDSVEYEIFRQMSPSIKQENLDKKNAEKGPKTDLNSTEIGIARTDMLKNRDIYMAIQSASHGIYVEGNNTANTAVDNLYEKNPDKFYKTFANTRNIAPKEINK